MSDLFLAGDLSHPPLLTAILGKAQVTPEAAILPGYRVMQVPHRSGTVLAPDDGSKAEGIVIRGLNVLERARLDYFQAVMGQSRQRLQLANGGWAETYLPIPPVADPEPWDAPEWRARWAETAGHAATEILRHFRLTPAARLRARLPSILSAAASRVLAQQSAPTTLRRAMAPEDVQVLSHEQPYAGFFAVDEYRLRHTRFDGQPSPVLNRSAFVSTDVVTVLPYDPVRDRVLLIEQFRIAPYARGDRQCWGLETIAGRIEPGEDLETTARREALEEAGLTLGPLTRVGGYYPSPGAKTEYIHAFIGQADLPDGCAGLGGLDVEGEDIRAHLVSYQRLIDLLDSGEIENAPLILSVHWLARHRETIGAGA